MSNPRMVLVFGEDHTDIASDKFMTEIISQLSSKSSESYVFLEEGTPTLDLDLLIKGAEKDLEAGKHSSALNLYGGGEKVNKRVGEKIEKFLELLKTLKKLGIQYKGIDDAKAIEIYRKTPSKGIVLRDAKLADGILLHADKGPVICRVGLDHFPGIQKKIMEELGTSEEINLRFLFIYPWNKTLHYYPIKDTIFEVLDLEVTDSTFDSSVAVVLNEVDKRQKALSECKAIETPLNESSSIEDIINEVEKSYVTVPHADLHFFKNPKNINTQIDLDLISDKSDPKDPFVFKNKK